MSNQIKSIKNIELSSLCNMKCDYCLSPHIKEHRTPGLMSFETFKKVADQILKFDEEGTQGEIWLHGTGESLLNKDLAKMARYLDDKSITPITISLSTNGLLIDDEIVEELKEAGINRIDVSCHDEDIALKAFAIIESWGIASSINYGSEENRFDWAGQLDIESTSHNYPFCPWIDNKECFVLHDGSIVSCCLDAYGTNVLGHIDDMKDLEIKPFELCKNCNHKTN